VTVTKQRKRRRGRRLFLLFALGGVGYAVRRARSESAGVNPPPAPRPAPGIARTPRPAADKLSAPERPAPSRATEKVADKLAAAPVPPAAADAGAGPFGPDSHAALDDGGQPAGFAVKGNADSMLYHVPGSSFYARTVAEVWFRSAEAAEAAGFQLPPSQRAKQTPTASPGPVAEPIPGTEALDSAPAKAPAKKAAAKKAPAKKAPAKKAAPPPPVE
jgi:hypothetical protein